jgi:hydroxypyruvate isomerase
MGTIHLSAADWCYVGKAASAEAYYQGLKELGYEAAEMVEPAHCTAAKSAGLRLLNIAGPWNINRAHELEKNIEVLKTSIAATAAAGYEQLIVLSGNRGQGPDQPAIPDDAGRRACVAALKGAAASAEKAGIVLTLEVFNQFDHPDYQCDSGPFAFDVTREVSSPAVKVLYDLYHMARMGEDVIDQALRNLPYIGHLHIAATPNRDLPTAESQPDYAKIVKAITAAGYTGFWGMEFIPRSEVLGELRQAATLFKQWS